MQDEKIGDMFMEIREQRGKIDEKLAVMPDQERRIRKLEAAPGSKWKTLVQSIISAIGGGIVAKFLFK